jgi:transposase InsO family protein
VRQVHPYFAAVTCSGNFGAHRQRPASPYAPTGANQVWSYDFVFDWCANGQKLKCLTVSDDWTREGLAIEVDGCTRASAT